MENSVLSAEAIFESARGISDAKGRAEFIAQACGRDAALREKVEALLSAQVAADEFFSEPVIKPPEIEVPVAEQVGDTIGNYRLLRQIGEGGCGAVYLAEQLRPVQRRVALKVVKLGMDTREVITRFQNEWQALAIMNHPSIARMLDVGVTSSGRPYFVMEYVEGQSLTAYCDSQCLSLADRLELFVEVCAAVQHAHQKGIIHRDLKPSNVLVAVLDGRAVPKVIDFGIAKALDVSTLTRTFVTRLGFFLGTPSYMSPEQATRGDADVDTRSDIYSLGVLLYELLAGATPFPAEELLADGFEEMFRRIRQDDPMRPSVRVHNLKPEEADPLATARNVETKRWVRQLRGDLDWIVLKCLEKDRTHRYGSANDLARDLKRFLNSETVSARPPSLVDQFRKWTRRNRLLTGAVTVAILGLMGGGLMLGIALVRERRARLADIAAEQLQADLRVEAENQRDRAGRSERDARGILDFMLSSLVDAANPMLSTHGFGPDITLREALLAAVPRISGTFSNQPMAELEVRERLAVTFYDLGWFTNAIAELERSVELADHGGKPAQAITNLARLGWVYQQLGDETRHLGYMQQAWQRAVDEFGRTNETTLAAQGHLGASYREQKRFPQAVEILETALELARSALPATNAVIHELVSQLAVTHEQAGNPDRAIPLLEETLEWRKRQFGGEAEQTTQTMCDLGATYLRADREAEGVVLLGEALRLRRSYEGESHIQTVQTYESIALAFHNVGRWELAASLWGDAFRLRAERDGPKHYLTRLASQRVAEARTRTMPQPLNAPTVLSAPENTR